MIECELCHTMKAEGEFMPLEPDGRQGFACTDCLEAAPTEAELEADAQAQYAHDDDEPEWDPRNGHHPECQCNECYYGTDAAKWLFNPSEY